MNKNILLSRLYQFFRNNFFKKEQFYESIQKNLIELQDKYGIVSDKSSKSLQKFLKKYQYYSNPKTVLYRFDISYLAPKLSDLFIAIEDFQVYQKTFVFLHEKIDKYQFTFEPKNLIKTSKLIETPIYINGAVVSYEELASKVQEKSQYIKNILSELDSFDNGMKLLQHQLKRLEELEWEIFYPENYPQHERLKHEYNGVYDIAIVKRQELFKQEKPLILLEISNLIDSRQFYDAGNILYNFIHKISLEEFLLLNN